MARTRALSPSRSISVLVMWYLFVTPGIVANALPARKAATLITIGPQITPRTGCSRRSHRSMNTRLPQVPVVGVHASGVARQLLLDLQLVGFLLATDPIPLAPLGHGQLTVSPLSIVYTAPVTLLASSDARAATRTALRRARQGRAGRPCAPPGRHPCRRERSPAGAAMFVSGPCGGHGVDAQRTLQELHGQRSR